MKSTLLQKASKTFMQRLSPKSVQWYEAPPHKQLRIQASKNKSSVYNQED